MYVTYKKIWLNEKCMFMPRVVQVLPPSDHPTSNHHPQTNYMINHRSV